MRENNYAAWLKLTSVRPNALIIFLKSLFAPREEPCDCLEKGIMFITGNLNKCRRCAEVMCKLDTHLFRGVISTALIGWVGMIFEGKFMKK